MTIKQTLIDNQGYIVEKYQSGFTLTDIAKEFNCNSGSVYFFLDEIGICMRKNRKDDDKISNHHEEIVIMHSQNCTASEISRKINFHVSAIIKYCKKKGLSFAHHNPRKKDSLKSKLNLIIQMYQSGMSTNNIGKELGHSGPEVSKLLKKNGIYVDKRRYAVDESFFEKIDTEEKAYILGFWYADGNNKKDGIRIQVCDEEIPNKFKEVMKFTGKVTKYPGRTENHQPQYLLHISRKKMADDLTKLGCPPNKSMILTFPDETIVPKHLIHHFARGYNDGDGNIYHYVKGGKWKIQILGTQEFLCGLTGASDIEGTWSKRFPERKNNNYNWVINKRSDVKKFLDWIYKDATIYLERKHDQYLEFQEFLKNKEEKKNGLEQ